jgi:hypothetical protein
MIMTQPTRRAPVRSEAQKKLMRRVAAEAEVQLLRRLRAYFARGRPLATLPVLSLRAQWIDACLALYLRDDDSRALELDDLDLEFDLRGLQTPALEVLPEVLRFNQRFRKQRRKRKPDSAASEQLGVRSSDLAAHRSEIVRLVTPFFLERFRYLPALEDRAARFPIRPGRRGKRLHSEHKCRRSQQRLAQDCCVLSREHDWVDD